MISFYFLPNLALAVFGKTGLDDLNLHKSITIDISLFGCTTFKSVRFFQTSSGSLRRGHCWLIRNSGGIDCCLIRNTTTTGATWTTATAATTISTTAATTVV